MIDVILKEIELYISNVYDGYEKLSLTPTKYVCSDNFFLDFTKKVEKSFSEVLLKMIDERKLVDVEVYKKANIDRRHFSKMRNKNYHPRKNTIIKFIFALKLNQDDADALLKTSGYVLTTSNLRDVIIMYFIENNEYDILKVNEVLEHYQLEYI